MKTVGVPNTLLQVASPEDGDLGILDFPRTNEVLRHNTKEHLVRIVDLQGFVEGLGSLFSPNADRLYLRYALLNLLGLLNDLPYFRGMNTPFQFQSDACLLLVTDDCEVKIRKITSHRNRFTKSEIQP